MDTKKSSAPAHHPEVVSGDPFAYAGRDDEPFVPHGCYFGLVFIGHLAEEDGEEVEVITSVACRRCNSR